jgi:hypothetical protein
VKGGPIPPSASRFARALLGFILVLIPAVALAPGARAQQAAPPPASATPQEPPPPAPPGPPPPAASPGAPLRLLKNFVLDGSIQPNVWLEGQWRMESNLPIPGGGNGTRNTVEGILALGFKGRFETGLTWGGVSIDPDQGSEESGAGDLEVYGKYLIHDAPLKVAVGGLVKIPTADSDKGLGSGSADWEGFVAVRRDFGTIQAVGSAGLRQNGDPDVDGVRGQASVLAGGGVLFELGKRCFGSVELSYESRRYEGLSSDFRLTPGFLLRLGERGFFRAGFGIGLSDGAPDTEALAGLGWAY